MNNSDSLSGRASARNTPSKQALSAVSETTLAKPELSVTAQFVVFILGMILESVGKGYYSKTDLALLRDWLLGGVPSTPEADAAAHAVFRQLPDSLQRMAQDGFPARLATFSKAPEPSLFDEVSVNDSAGSAVVVGARRTGVPDDGGRDGGTSPIGHSVCNLSPCRTAGVRGASECAPGQRRTGDAPPGRGIRFQE